MEIIIGEYMKNKPGAFSGRCVLTATFQKAIRWLMGHDLNETPAPEKAPDRDGGPV